MVLRKRDDGGKEALQEGAPLVGGAAAAAKPGGRAAHYTGAGHGWAQFLANQLAEMQCWRHLLLLYLSPHALVCLSWLVPGKISRGSSQRIPSATAFCRRPHDHLRPGGGAGLCHRRHAVRVSRRGSHAVRARSPFLSVHPAEPRCAACTPPLVPAASGIACSAGLTSASWVAWRWALAAGHFSSIQRTLCAVQSCPKCQLCTLAGVYPDQYQCGKQMGPVWPPGRCTGTHHPSQPASLPPLHPQAMASFQQQFFPELLEANLSGEQASSPCELRPASSLSRLPPCTALCLRDLPSKHPCVAMNLLHYEVP